MGGFSLTLLRLMEDMLSPSETRFEKKGFNWRKMFKIERPVGCTKIVSIHLLMDLCNPFGIQYLRLFQAILGA